MKKFKILPFLLILLLSVTLMPLTALAADEPSVGARAAIVVDADTGAAYYEKNADQAMQPASTTKMMTALLTVEAAERGEIAFSDSVTASGNFNYNLEEDSSDANPRIQAGENMTVEDLLYCVMLPSANEACNILASYVSGSVDAFVDAMNARARELGCENTHFMNANGLEEEDHYSSAADLARIAREAMNHSKFSQICGTYRHTVPETNVSEARELINSNGLLDKDGDYYYEYAYGIKTGYFTNAGYCLVSIAEKDDMNVICVVLGSQSPGDQFTDSITLYKWFFDNFEYRQILSSTQTVATVPVNMGTSDTVDVRAEDVVSVLLPKDFDSSHLGYQYTLYHEAQGETLTAPLNAGTLLGEVSVVETDDNGYAVQTLGTSKLVAASTVEMSRVDYIRSQVKDLFLEPVVRKILTILIVLLAIYVLLVVFYYIQRIRHLRSVRRAKRERALRQTEEEARWLTLPAEEYDEPGIDYFTEAKARPALQETKSEVDEILEDEEFASGRIVAHPKKTTAQSEGQAETPRRRLPKNELTDDDFFDSFFN